MSGLLGFLPDRALPLVLVGIAFLLVLGFLRLGRAIGLVAMICGIALLGRMAEGFLGLLPIWVVVLIVVAGAMSVLRAVAGLVVGKRAADTMTGTLAADVVRLVVRLILLPFTILGLLFGAGRPGRP